LAVARDRARLERVRDEAGGRIEIGVADATDPRALDALLHQSHPTLIVLCAGAQPKLAPIDEHSWETFSSPWNQDVKMAFELGQAALRLPLRPGSTVVFVSSGAGLGGSPLSGGYAGSKRMQMFLASYFQGVSSEKALGIRFLAVVPKQLIVGTQTADAASRAYAARARISQEKYMERFDVPLVPEATAEAILAVARRELAEGATIVGISGRGVEIL
jgi:short-subunit dehydrogenase